MDSELLARFDLIEDFSEDQLEGLKAGHRGCQV